MVPPLVPGIGTILGRAGPCELIDVVLVAFIDESYPQGMSTYCVSAVVFDMVSLFNLGDEIRAVMKYATDAHGVPAGTELHAHPLMQGSKGWKAVAGKHRVKEKIYTKVLGAIVTSGGKVFVEGMDVERQKARYSKPLPPHEVTLGYALERVSDYAAGKDRQVLVVADEVPDQEQHAASMALYSLVGTPGYRTSTLPQILHPVRFDDSSLHHGLQAADFVAYLYNRRKSVVEKDDRAAATKERMWGVLRPAIERERFWVP
ncbi:hypothetical protein J2Y41_004661 [Arthrobacter sp. 1088]|uniref:DUF3800 domain-containing protein n=1 Tax=Arthrobacter sp. 1088 TaxID=2817768 RepID=UPI002856BD25|nr:DUF3800 domain-containing protein [Arthrobacter sp. 1088]MDR6689057.1 hypothetical protein [Arthrobacter sp. 1088]